MQKRTRFSTLVLTTKAKFSPLGKFIPCPDSLPIHLSFHSNKVVSNRVKYWEIIADNLSKAGFSVGWVSTLDLKRRTIWVVEAHRDGKRFVVRADEKLTAFVELQREIHKFAVSLVS